MNDRTLQVLEFHKIMELLKKYADTNLGIELIDQIIPSVDVEEVKILQRETDEARAIIRLNKEIPLGGVTDIRPSLSRSGIGGVLREDECLAIANTIYGANTLKRFIANLEDDFPLLTSYTNKIVNLREVEERIKRCIDENGHVTDHASSNLRNIRSSMRNYERSVRERLEGYIRNRSNLLSDSIITIRNDRYVLPVKHEHRGTIGGIVHDQSSSGQTLFMEPNAIVELNNRLQTAIAKERQEVERILKELSELIATHEVDLGENLSILAKIDVIDARAKLGREMNASMPNINTDRVIKLNQARHPLIPADEVVANDVEIGDDFTTILITGPNTGGKTVVLKMIGLCTLMAQSGLQIPAMDGSEISVFERVFADIGDEQSIEQSLSTFSSHMSNIVKILDDVDDQTLVLFDELGAGTDPQEGASLAMAILDEVISRDARVIATTHYPELKAYGFNREHVINASVEFDAETLQPTYRLLLGVPGRSNAFDISKRLGLNRNIIERAKDQINPETQNVDAMITSLEQSRKLSEKSYEEAYRVLEESEKIYEALKDEWKQFTNQKERLYKKAEEKADEALMKAERKAKDIVDQIRKMQTTSFKEHEWIEARKSLDEASINLTKKEAEKTKDMSDVEFQKGDDVKLLTVNQNGTILEKVNDNEYLVQVGMMRVNVKKKDLEPLSQKKQKRVDTTPVTMVQGSTHHVKTSLDLRGERFEDAKQQLEQYIDAAILAGHSSVTIIHGKGTGALRKAVEEIVKTHPQIGDYRQGKQGEGGSGVTIIEFK